MKTNAEKRQLVERCEPKTSRLKDLFASPEFRSTLETVGDLLTSAERNELRVGEILRAGWVTPGTTVFLTPRISQSP